MTRAYRADLASAISAQRPSPCQEYGCSKRERCATEMLACDAFRAYVMTGSARSPLAVIDGLESGSVEDGPKPKSGLKLIAMNAEPYPTRTGYLALFPEPKANKGARA